MHKMSYKPQETQETMEYNWGEDPTQEGQQEEPDLNTPKRWGNNRPHRSKAKRAQERKTAKASKKRNR